MPTSEGHREMSASQGSGDDGANDHHDAHEQNGHTVMRRNRSQLACNLCRNSKLKCDRAHPCSQCIKRGREELCVYAKPLEKKKAQRSKNNMQNRLQHLESLVVTMMKEKEQAQRQAQNGANPPTPEASTPSDNSPASQSIYQGSSVLMRDNEISRGPGTMGQFVVGKTETTYIGATHWAAILDDIEEVKSYFQNESEEEEDEPEDPPSFVFGHIPFANREEILAAFPEKGVVDRFVHYYFQSDDHAKLALHRPTFEKEYRKFWLDPSRAPLKWVSILCSIMCLSTFGCLRANEEQIDQRGTPVELIATYRTMAAQSLVLGNYTKPGPYTIEALFFYFQTEFLRISESHMSVWLIGGVVIRMALRMGYHRDAKHRPNISVFEGEMRRRLWFILTASDLLLSFHVGLPSMIRSVHSDTETPSNLRDEDFGPESVQLPPSRPLEDRSLISYGITKTRIASVFGIIAEQSNSTILPSYAAVLEIDNMLVQAHNLVPDWLKIRPLSQSLMDSADLLRLRFNVAHLFHKSRCVLHRRWLLMAKIDKKYAFSKQMSIESALALMEYQRMIHEAQQGGGPLSKYKWFGGGLLLHDFLLAAMIVCLALRHDMSKSEAESLSQADREKEQKEMLNALIDSYIIWRDMDNFEDSRKAASVVAAMLRKLRSRLTDQSLVDEIASLQDDGKPLKIVAALPCGPETGALKNIPTSHGPNVVGGAKARATPQVPLTSLPPLDPIANASDVFDGSNVAETNHIDAMIDVTTELDWNIWDHQVIGSTHPYGADYVPDGQEWAPELGLDVDLQDLSLPNGNALFQQQANSNLGDFNMSVIDPGISQMEFMETNQG